MMNDSIKWMIAFIFVAAITSCGASRKIKTGAGTIGADSTLPADETLRRKAIQLLQADSLPFETLSSRVKVNYQDIGGSQPEVNAFLRMKKDEFIWVSITATFLNIEGARVLMTPDSIVIINKLDRTIENYPFSYIQNHIDLPLTFSDVQKLIGGKCILTGDSVSAVLSSDAFLNIVTESRDTERSSMNSLFFTLPSLLLAKQSIKISSGRENYFAELLFDDYERSGSLAFSTHRSIAIPARHQSIQLTFRQLEFNKELSVPFNRPEGYTIK